MAKRKQRAADNQIPIETIDSETDDFSDVELEKQVLRYIAISDSSMALHCTEELFLSRTHRSIFRALQELRVTYPVKVLPEAISRHVKGAERKSPYSNLQDDIAEIIDAPDLSEAAAFETLTALKRTFARVRLFESGQKIQELARNDNVDEAFKILQNSMVYDQSRVEFGDYLKDYEARLALLKERKRQHKDGLTDLIPTGIEKFDELSGGLKKGEVGVIVAETGAGKSTAKLNFAMNAWLSGYNVVFIGLEMSKEENEFRADTLLTSIPVRAFRLARLTKPDMETWDFTIQALRKQRKNYLEFVGMTSTKMPEVFALVENVSARRGPVDLLVLDHIGRVKRDFPYSTHEKIGENFDDLSNWAKHRKVGVWTSGQMDDAGLKGQRKGNVMAANVKYAKSIAELAQVVMVLFQTEQDIVAGTMQMLPVKGRNIKKGMKIVLQPDLDRMILDQISFYNGALSKLQNFVANGGKKIKRIGG